DDRADSEDAFLSTNSVPETGRSTGTGDETTVSALLATLPDHHADTLSVLVAAAETSTAVEIEAAIRSAAAKRRSAARSLEIEALLLRLAEVDPHRLASAARQPPLPAKLVAGAYRRWAESDLAAAIGALRSIDAPLQRRAAALALLDVAGFDAGATEVAAGLTDLEKPSFIVDMLAKQAETDARGALDAALALDARGSFRSDALYAVSVAVARVDPRGGLSLAARIDDSAETEAMRAGIETWWPYFDPAGYLEFLLEAPALGDNALTFGAAALASGT